MPRNRYRPDRIRESVDEQDNESSSRDAAVLAGESDYSLTGIYSFGITSLNDFTAYLINSRFTDEPQRLANSASSDRTVTHHSGMT